MITIALGILLAWLLLATLDFWVPLVWMAVKAFIGVASMVLFFGVLWTLLTVVSEAGV